MCRALVRNESRAEELAQDVFVRAFGALEGFRGEASSRTWILAIARNRCMDELRRGAISPIEDDPDALEAPLDDTPLPAELCENRAEVLRALHVLPELQRALVVLRFVHGFDYAELGKTFGIKPGTARMRVSRALARMRDELVPMPEAECLALDLEEAADEMGAAPAEAMGAPPMPAAAPQSSSVPARRSRRKAVFGRGAGGAPLGPPPAAPSTDFGSALGRSSRALTARLLGLARSL